MLIDINAYVGHWPFMQLKYNTCHSLLERMDKFGVDISVVTNLNGIFYKNAQLANKELHTELNDLGSNRNRFIPFAVINPLYAGWQYDLDKCINKFGMKGVHIYPRYHDYAIQDPSLIELVKRARDFGIPIAFAYRMVDSRQRSWMDIDYVTSTDNPEWSLKDFFPMMREVPDAKYMVLNVAQDFDEFSLKPEDKIKFEEADVLIDTSGRALRNLSTRLNRFEGAKYRYAFGTHSPILDYLTGMLRIESLDDSEWSGETKKLLRSGNAKRFLDL